MTYKKIKLLDCTLRDGGYYNNWNFGIKFTNNYLKLMKDIGIEFTEIGFRFLRDDKLMGENAYTRENFIKSIKIPNNLKIGIMVNASDFFEGKNNYKSKLNKYFSDLNRSKIYFIRIACHQTEIYKIKPIIKWFNKKGVLVTVNLMQISELNDTEMNINLICKFLDKNGVKVLYLADSLGSLSPKNIKKIYFKFKKYWNGELGLHAHDNLNQALNNSLTAISYGATWIDSTLMGMGRGPGNLSSEKIVNNLFKSKYKNLQIKKFNKKFMEPLKKKYKWGTNLYYKFSAKNKIHPTYVQKLLLDKRYDKNNYLKILENLKKVDAKKFNPFKLIASSNIYTDNIKSAWQPINDLKDKEVLVIGSGSSVKRNLKKIKELILSKNLLVFVLNTFNKIPESLINFRVVCHPLRILSDSFFYDKSKTNLICPYSMMEKKFRKLINIKNKLIYDFGLKINTRKKFKVEKKFVQLPQPLAIAYTIGVCSAGGVSKIFLAGFDGFKKDDVNSDDTNIFFKNLKVGKKKDFIKFVTKTNYKLN